MKKVNIQNLAMIITDNCNLKCEHCLRGKKEYNNMSREIVETILSQVRFIDNLYLCGGEITLNINTVDYIFKYIINNNIILNEVNAIINGTIFNERLLTSLNYINHYISKVSTVDKQKSVNFYISSDEYHKSELERLNLYKNYLENIKKYQLSKHFSGLYNLPDQLIREGKAINLEKNKTSRLHPSTIYITYVDENNRFNRNAFCKIGPTLCVNTFGLITELNASIFSQNELYNYGNVMDSTIEKIALSKGKLVKPARFDKLCQKELKLCKSQFKQKN